MPKFTFQRNMAHSPEWMRKEAKLESNFQHMRTRLLKLDVEQGQQLRRAKPMSVLRRERVYGLTKTPSLAWRKRVPTNGVSSILRNNAVESWVYNVTNQRVGIVKLDAEHFNVPIRRDIVQRVVQWQLAKKRQGTHRTKDRTEVAGTTRKPHPQKGTGRARASCLRTPLHYHGGRANPRRPRDYSYPLPKAIRRLGLRIALSDKVKSSRLFVLDAAVMKTHKTRDLQRLLCGFNLTDVLGNSKSMRKVVIIHGDYEMDPNFTLASRNLSALRVHPARGANVYDIVSSHTVFITTQGIVDLQKRLNTKRNPIKFVAPRSKLIPNFEILRREDAEAEAEAQARTEVEGDAQ